ncbi:MAG: hypothetical protein R3D98_17320 [Candidatus Krumholzibacteriia bacterium]
MLEKLKQKLLGRKDLPPFQVPGQIRDSSRILVLVDTDLASLVFHAPLLAAIRRTWPGASLDFLVPESFASVVIPSGLARQVMVYGDKQLGGWKPAQRNLQRTLAGGGYDVSLVVASEPNPILEGLGLASGAVMRLGPSHDGAWPAVNLELRAADGDAYLGDRVRQLAPSWGWRACGIARPGRCRATRSARRPSWCTSTSRGRRNGWSGSTPGRTAPAGRCRPRTSSSWWASSRARRAAGSCPWRCPATRIG